MDENLRCLIKDMLHALAMEPDDGEYPYYIASKKEKHPDLALVNLPALSERAKEIRAKLLIEVDMASRELVPKMHEEKLAEVLHSNNCRVVMCPWSNSTWAKPCNERMEYKAKAREIIASIGFAAAMDLAERRLI